MASDNARGAPSAIIAPQPVSGITLNLSALTLSGANKVAIVTGMAPTAHSLKVLCAHHHRISLLGGHTGVGMSIANNLAALGYHVVRDCSCR